MSLADSPSKKINLRKLPFSPTVNPLLDGFTVQAKRKQIRTGGVKEMVDIKTGEVSQAVIIEEQELDEIHFVKVFTAGIRAAYELTRTGSRVFQAILEVYQNAPMSGGFADSIYLAWFDGGLDGRKLDMSEKTFQRGLVEIIDKGFLFPRNPNLFWVNPNLFFRGDRATFIRTYRRKQTTVDMQERANLEALGQNRLID
ncbi:hypothetical protein ANCDUO_20878 [Ancylostoma duodenale]|uniref:Firmicute plasmid replication protein n=1 Tax=Ancylostoma duodenale TaxID=51022 RepID=A0A0C2BYJ6_9BILA|nr:hypothetical protein ANCDUO_20878 [Ancylostoma duodenale]